MQGDYPAPIIIYPYFRWFVKNLTLSMTCAVKPGDKEAVLELIGKGKFDANRSLLKFMQLMSNKV
ncbi:MAG: hypothetical protein AABY84_11210 [Candidatus Firestonebacteria bacterium]